jgi:stage II sporulation protein D
MPAIVQLPDEMREPAIRVRLTEEEDRPPAVKKSAYRGRIQTFKLADGKYVAINVLPMDAYLAGVLPKELYGSWDPATYRAQAIAARTFALFQIMTLGQTKQWDVNCDESSQMYGGIAGETAKSRKAVADTRGQVLIAASRGNWGIFCSFYSACIGGASQNPNEAWGDPAIAPLAARQMGAIDANCPNYAWPTMTLSKADLTRCIRNWGKENAIAYLETLGRIRTVVIAKRDALTHRPTEFLLTDTAGRSAPIRAEEFRLALLYDPEDAAPKPLSSNFGIKDAGANLLLVNGRGYGHGIGMSQWGAQALAEKGWSHEQILAFYYPGSKTRELW